MQQSKHYQVTQLVSPICFSLVKAYVIRKKERERERETFRSFPICRDGCDQQLFMGFSSSWAVFQLISRKGNGPRKRVLGCCSLGFESNVLRRGLSRMESGPLSSWYHPGRNYYQCNSENKFLGTVTPYQPPNNSRSQIFRYRKFVFTDPNSR